MTSSIVLIANSIAVTFKRKSRRAVHLNVMQQLRNTIETLERNEGLNGLQVTSTNN